MRRDTLRGAQSAKQPEERPPKRQILSCENPFIAIPSLNHQFSRGRSKIQILFYQQPSPLSTVKNRRFRKSCDYFSRSLTKPVTSKFQRPAYTETRRQMLNRQLSCRLLSLSQSHCRLPSGHRYTGQCQRLCPLPESLRGDLCPDASQD